MKKELQTLRGLGPKSSYQLKTIGVHTKDDLIKLGAIPAYLKLKQHYTTISLNFLYALVGAIEDKHWREIAATRREELLMELDGYMALSQLSANNSQQQTNQQ